MFQVALCSRLRRLAKLYKSVEEAEIAHGEGDGLFNRNTEDETADSGPEVRNEKVTNIK